MAGLTGRFGAAAQASAFRARRRAGQAMRSLRDACGIAWAVASSPEAAALAREVVQAGRVTADALGVVARKAAPVVADAAVQMACEAVRSAGEALRSAGTANRPPARGDGHRAHAAEPEGVSWEPARDAAAWGPGAVPASVEVWVAQVEPDDGDVTDVPAVFVRRGA